MDSVQHGQKMWAWRDSNQCRRFRRPVLYALSNGGPTFSSCRHRQLECTIIQFHGMSQLLLDIKFIVRTEAGAVKS